MKYEQAHRRIYFDWAATSIPDADICGPGLDLPFGNPSSQHREGKAAREVLEEARSRCAAVLGCKAEQLYFTGGGTESNAIAIFSQLLRPSRAGSNASRPGAIVSAGEHPSVRENVGLLERFGLPVFVTGLESQGWVSEKILSSALSHARNRGAEARFVALMAVNNETGAVSDVPGLVSMLRGLDGPPLYVHCDAVQAAGKIPLNLQAWDVDSASLSAHKLGGPRGIGLLYLKKPLETLYRGGHQEQGVRPGTENVCGAAALARCLDKRASPRALETAYQAAEFRMQTLIEALKALPRCKIIPEERAAFAPPPSGAYFSPWILQAAFSGIPGEVMARCLDDAGFAVSTGSACSSSESRRPVLVAMGVDDTTAFEGIRISQGWTTTIEDIEALLDAIKGILCKI